MTRVAPPRLPAGDEVEALVELREQPRDLRRIVLQIRVDRDDDFASRGLPRIRPANAAALPKLRRKRTTRTSLWASWSLVSAAKVPSVEPSSTKTTSHGRPSGSRAAASSSWSSATLRSSSCTGTITEITAVSVCARCPRCCRSTRPSSECLRACTHSRLSVCASPTRPGRVLAEDVVSRVDLPPFPSSAMDGFAVRAADTPGTLPVVFRIAAGAPAERPLAPGEAMEISTGGSVPDGADAVVPIEAVVTIDDNIEIAEAVAAGAHVRPVGGDVRSGAPLLLPEPHSARRRSAHSQRLVSPPPRARAARASSS